MTFVLFAVLALPAMAQTSGEYDYLTFRTIDGTEQSISTCGLKITFPNGQMKAVSQESVVEYPLSQLSVMFFASEPTAIHSVVDGGVRFYVSHGTLKSSNGALQDVEVYAADGRRVGVSQLPDGIYVVKYQGKTYKVIAR